MTRNEVEEKVQRIIADHLGVDVASVTQEAHIMNELGADSLDLVELAMMFERDFNITIPDEIAERFERVGDVTNYIAKEKE